MDKVKVGALTETASIETELQYTIALIKNMYHGQIGPIKSLKSEVGGLKIGMIDDPRLEQWSEDMYSAITLVF